MSNEIKSNESNYDWIKGLPPEPALGLCHLMSYLPKGYRTGKATRKYNVVARRFNKVMSYIDNDAEAFFGFRFAVETWGLKEALKSYRYAMRTHVVPEVYREFC